MEGFSRNWKDPSYELPPGDVLIHLSESSVASEVTEETKALNLLKLQKILSSGYRRIIYASSGVIYGDSQSTPHKETDVPAASSPYARSKVEAEALVLGAGGVALRLGNVYGPYPKKQTVLEAIVSQMKASKSEITLLNQSAVRDYVWVEDAAECFIEAALRSDVSGIFNVGSGTGTSVTQIVEKLSVLTRKKLLIVESSPLNKPSELILDTEKASGVLNWRATTSLETGLKKLWENSL